MTYVLASGNPEDAQYTPYGATRDFFFCHDSAVVCAGPADTGKTMAALWKLHATACKYPNASIVIARKQLTDIYPTVLQTLLKKVLKIEDVRDPSTYGWPVSIYGGEKPQWIDYPNNSRIWFAGLDKPGKVLSSERDIIYINQVEECSLADWETCGTRTTGRAGNVPFNQLIGDANPRAPTHWIKTRAAAGALTLFNSTHRDNPELFDPVTGEQTPEGEKRLGALSKTTGTRRLRLYFGLWVQPEGAIYSQFISEPQGEEKAHVVNDFPIPITWPRIVAIDPMGAHVAALWLAYDPETGIRHVYREYSEPFGLATRGHAANILWLSGFRAKPTEDVKARMAEERAQFVEPIMAWVGGGPSERQARTDWAAAGIPLLEPGIPLVWDGIGRVAELLNDFKLVVHSSCTGLISELGEYQRKVNKRTGDVTEVIENKDAFNHNDCLRYAINWWTAPDERIEVVDRSIRIGERW